MSGDAPARLTSALLVKKGNAAPASYGMPLQSISSLVQEARQVRNLFPAFSSTKSSLDPGAEPKTEPGVETSEPVVEPEAERPVEVRVAGPRRQRKPRQARPKDTRARLTLRVDSDRYLRLKLVSAHRRQSLQQVLTEALDHYLKEVAPSLCAGRCACLEAGRLGDPPPSGCRMA